MTLLPQYSLIGNPLHFPVENSNGEYDIAFDQLPAGQYVGVSSKIIGKKVNFSDVISKGSLLLIKEGMFFGTDSVPVTLENLINCNFVEKSDYKTFFKAIKAENSLEFLKQIPEANKVIFYVTPEGHDKIKLSDKIGNSPNKKFNFGKFFIPSLNF